jgi:hypothetical protein
MEVTIPSLNIISFSLDLTLANNLVMLVSSVYFQHQQVLYSCTLPTVGMFFPKSVDVFLHNRCVVPYYPPKNINGHVGDNYNCLINDLNQSYVFRPDHNQYYTSYEPLFGCQSSRGAWLSLTFADLQRVGIEPHSKHHSTMPSANEMLLWAREKLHFF